MSQRRFHFRVWSLATLLLAGTVCAQRPYYPRVEAEPPSKPATVATEIDGAAATAAAREALSSRGSLPWYDAEKDDLRPLDLPPPKDNTFDNRRSKWEEGPANAGTPGTPIAPNLPTVTPPFSILTFLFNAMRIVIYIVIVVAVCALIGLFVWIYLKGETTAATTATTDEWEVDEADEERIESLPFVVARPRGDMLDEAREQCAQGNYRLAIIYLFSYLLIQLDRHQHIVLAKGKTNRQYLRELKHSPELRAILEFTMNAFEDVFFGNYALSREACEECLRRVDEFQRHLELAPA